jgi:hypothetical protein
LLERIYTSLVSDEVDRPGGRVAAIESALRAAQKFDALEVRDVGGQPLVAAHGNAVHVDTRGVVLGHLVIEVAHAPYEQVGRGATRREACDHD